ncbi:F-box protein [Phanerochaete sordida]|uniref:F-box protein n=1 Tax=Phanerochaete sordida TaxID=48140 RepID=A0A9P3GD09_9APHY|nr:F-box protein [Phanerochaete sordida]
MVSADNLNLDCLELVFAYLSGNDLFSVSLVSKSFLAGVVPYLYRTLAYHLGNAKRYPSVMTPFETIVKHPSLAVHVHNIDIRTVPLVKAAVQPRFMGNVIKCLDLCKNLRTFTCTPNILPALLVPLKPHENLRGIRVNATLTMQQAEIIKSLTQLRTLALDACSWNIVDALPDWTRRMSATLTTLTLHTIQELNDTVLNSMLPNLPHLTSLYVVGCAKIEHGTILQATRHTPRLENLAFTAWDSTALPAVLPELPSLRHLAVDTHIAPIVNGLPNSSSPSLWPAVVVQTKAWGCALASITLRLSDKVALSHSFVQDLLDAHGATLEYIALINVDAAWESVRAIAVKAKKLERLAMHIPTKDVKAFSAVLGRSQTLQTITDIGESHTTHGSHAFLTRDSVRTMMGEVPGLKKLVTTDRVWTCEKTGDWRKRTLRVRLEKRKVSCPTYWFYPR